jgi:hypothetical protein
MLDFIFIIAGLLLLVPLLVSAMGQRKKTLANALPRAVEIAKVQTTEVGNAPDRWAGSLQGG